VTTLWKQANDGVMITRISSELNPDHPYKNYLGDPKTNAPYCKAVGGGFKKIDRPEKPCPPILWESDLEGQASPRKRERKPLLTFSVFQEGNRLTIEFQPAA
jgi:hypothetical protein